MHPIQREEKSGKNYTCPKKKPSLFRVKHAVRHISEGRLKLLTITNMYLSTFFFGGGNRGESAAPFRTITFPRLCDTRTPPPQYTGDIQEGKEGRRGTYHLFLIRRGLLAAETEEADMIVTDLVTSLLCEGAQYSPLNYRKI